MAFMLFFATLPLVIYNFSILSLTHSRTQTHISVMEMYFSIKIYTLTQGRLARITATIIKKKTQAKALKSIHKSESKRMEFDMFFVFIWGEILCLV